MNAEVLRNKIEGLDSINLTERQRARVKNAVQQSDLIVSALVSLAQHIGLAARPVTRKS